MDINIFAQLLFFSAIAYFAYQTNAKARAEKNALFPSTKEEARKEKVKYGLYTLVSTLLLVYVLLLPLSRKLVIVLALFTLAVFASMQYYALTQSLQSTTSKPEQYAIKKKRLVYLILGLICAVIGVRVYLAQPTPMRVISHGQVGDNVVLQLILRLKACRDLLEEDVFY